MLGPAHLPRHPLVLARFGMPALLPAATLGRTLFRGERARALLAGCAAHSALPFTRPVSAAVGDALPPRRPCRDLADRSGRIRGDHQRAGRIPAIARRQHRDRPRGAIAQRPARRPASISSTPAQRSSRTSRRRCCPRAIVQPPPPLPLRPGRVQGRLGARRAHPLARPRMPRCRRPCTSAARSMRSPPREAAVWRGEHPDRPFVLVVQPSLVDPSRAPAGKHTGWAYCHVPSGSTRRSHRRHRAPDGALRARVSRPHPRRGTS